MKNYSDNDWGIPGPESADKVLSALESELLRAVSPLTKAQKALQTFAENIAGEVQDDAHFMAVLDVLAGEAGEDTASRLLLVMSQKATTGELHASWQKREGQYDYLRSPGIRQVFKKMGIEVCIEISATTGTVTVSTRPNQQVANFIAALRSMGSVPASVHARVREFHGAALHTAEGSIGVEVA